ncbi:MAG TPA: DUF1800 domain-containing protein [Blastocatellia bacterium]|nr:DUF1800 domain-containing protein [Blastocatellia bacterium]
MRSKAIGRAFVDQELKSRPWEGTRSWGWLQELRRPLYPLIALLTCGSMVLGSFVPGLASPEAKNSKARLDTDKRVMQVLNRIEFGPRPGELQQVEQIGLDKYIEQQLHPDRIDDSAVEARLRGLESLHMDTSGLYQKYPQPGLIARQLGIGQQAKVGANARRPQPPPQNPTGVQPGDSGQATVESGGGQAADESPAGGAAKSQVDPNEANRQQAADRRRVLEYYKQHGIKQPQMLLAELQAQKLVRAVYSQRQLQEVLTDFWFNHFNIYWPKGADKWLTTDFEDNAIRPHVLGKFKDLLMATAKSPAMLVYLDNDLSSSPDARPPRPPIPGRFGGFGRPRFGGPPFWPVPPRPAPPQQAANNKNKRKPGINENYGRELMELHTLGVDGGYTQKDVQEVARCFTGWTIEQPRRGARFVFRDWMHDNGQKVVLGHVIPAGGGERDGEKVIDILAHSPSTAKFISKKLCRRFVSDDPPSSLVDKVANVYLKSDGDIREMMRTILKSPEFYSQNAYRAKIKSPFELAVSAIRALGGDTDGSPALGQYIAKMGEPLYRYQAPTGYPDTAQEWVNTGALLERLNFGIALASNKIRGTVVPARAGNAPELAQAPDSSGETIVKQAILELLGGDISPQSRAVLDKQMLAAPTAEPKESQARSSGEPPVATGEPAMANSDTMQEGPVARRKNGDKYDRASARAAANWPLAATVGPPEPVDPRVAKAFGLVLGTPEFQRR